MRQEIRRAVIGAVVGAIVGTAAAVLVARVHDSRTTRSGVSSSSIAAPVTLHQAVAIAMQVINVVRQLINLA